MNKVIAVNLNGAAYQVEEAGYDALRVYLESAARRLDANPDRAEILADIEQAIAEKFRALLTAHKNVVTTAEVNRIVSEMGPVEDGSAAPPEPGAAQAAADPAPAAPPKRIYRLPDGAMLAGVCNGAAAYFNVDATLIRAGCVGAAMLSCVGSREWVSILFWIAVYTVLAVVLPPAQTPAEQSAARGGHDAPRTAQEFIRRARAGYYAGMKTWHDRDARREWKRKFKREMRAWRHEFAREAVPPGPAFAGAPAQPWTPPAVGAAAGIALPIIALLQLGLFVGLLLAVISLVDTGLVFGRSVPPAMPGGTAVLAMVLVYALLTLPLRATRRALLGWRYSHLPYRHPAAGLAVALVAIGNAVVWAGAAAFVVWLLVHHPTEVGRALGTAAAAIARALQAAAAWFRQL